MTIHDLIIHLENLSVTTGEDMEVKLVDDIGLMSYAVTPDAFKVVNGVLLIQ